MTLYHVSNKDYIIGNAYSINDFEGDETYFYHQLPDTHKEVEQILNENCPNSDINRKKAFYLFHSAEDAYFYAKSNKKLKNKIFEVDVHSPFGGFPICLVQTILKNLADRDLCRRLASDYWDPKEDWKVLEYITKEISVIRIVQDNIHYAQSQFNYQLDYERAKIYVKKYEDLSKM